ncbi:ATP-binding protein [candidate division WOR-3 bacterium]|nr:ATP-binding protein [candidate division WOR-3 bacterium]
MLNNKPCPQKEGHHRESWVAVAAWLEAKREIVGIRKDLARAAASRPGEGRRQAVEGLRRRLHLLEARLAGSCRGAAARGETVPGNALCREHELDPLERDVVETLFALQYGPVGPEGTPAPTLREVVALVGASDQVIADQCLSRLLPSRRNRLVSSHLIRFDAGDQAQYCNNPTLNLTLDAAHHFATGTTLEEDEDEQEQPKARSTPAPDVAAALAREEVFLPGPTMTGLNFAWARLMNGPVLDRWGVTRGHAPKHLALLFYGPPGTGKSLTAGCLARALGKGLERVCCPDILDMFVGQSEKNIQRSFTRAEHDDALLVFDEADVILGRRGAIHRASDRYANAIVNTVLTALDRFRGAVVFTSNHVESLDPAAANRISLKVEFPAPDAELRARIWRAKLPPETPRSQQVDFAALGRDYLLTGRQIASAVLIAVAAAAARIGTQGDDARVEMADLAAAAESEAGGPGSEDRPRQIGFSAPGRAEGGC